MLYIFAYAFWNLYCAYSKFENSTLITIYTFVKFKLVFFFLLKNVNCIRTYEIFIESGN